MRLSLAGLWQVSPLTDLSIPQDDITFPASLSSVLPETMSESMIADQEWHLMHDIEVDEAMLAVPCVELVLAGIDYNAEVRLNGRALFDCDGTQREYRKEVQEYLQLGRNRFEVLFLEEDEDLLFDEDFAQGYQAPKKLDKQDERMGIWKEPYLQFIPNVRLDQVVTEQIWHHGGGCEFKVDLIYQTFKPGLVSASIKFNGMKFVLPIDVRAEHTGIIFQVEAPIIGNPLQPTEGSAYMLEVELDGQQETTTIVLNPSECVTQFLRD